MARGDCGRQEHQNAITRIDAELLGIELSMVFGWLAMAQLPISWIGRRGPTHLAAWDQPLE